MGGSKVREARARSVMWTNKQCKTMLTHVFKPRWLVLILLSAENRRREKERREDVSLCMYVYVLCGRDEEEGKSLRFSFSLSKTSVPWNFDDDNVECGAVAMMKIEIDFA